MSSQVLAAVVMAAMAAMAVSRTDVNSSYLARCVDVS